MPAKSKSGLGRGLDALLRPETSKNDLQELQNIAIDSIVPNRYQPRRAFNEETLRELADSIAQKGVLEPILVRPQIEGYELIAGERRLRAAKLAGLDVVPAIVRFYDDRQTAEIALIENLQREDLNPIEEATAFSRMLQEFDLTQEELAQRIGRSRSHLANTLRLLNLPPLLQEYLTQGLLEVGHARSLLTLSFEKQLQLSREIISKKYSVREAEARAKEMNTIIEKKTLYQAPSTALFKPDPRVAYWENRMKSLLQVKVRFTSDIKGGGKIEINYADADELERILALMLESE